MKPRVGKARKKRSDRDVGPRSQGRFQRALDDCARREIEAALAENNGNVTRTAEALGLTRMGLQKRLSALRIDRTRFEQ